MKLLGSLFWLLLFAVPLAAQTAAVPQQEQCAIEGAVTRSGSGLPLDKVEITMDIKGAQEPPLVTTTDANGHFVVANLEPGHYSLRAERAGYVGQTYGQRKKNREGVVLILGPGEKLRGIDFRLVATGVITGHVLGEDNEPIVGAYVQASEFRYSQGRRRLLEGGRASTNDLGEYRIYGLQPGHYYLAASEESRGTIRQPSGVKPEERYAPTFYPNVNNLKQAVVVDAQQGGEVRGVDITALRSRTFHIRGRIQGAGSLARYDRLHLLSESDFGGREDRSPDAKGNFDLGGILPGGYVLSVTFWREGKYYAAWRRVEVGNSDVNDVTLVASTWTELVGRMRVEGDKKVDLSKLSVLLLRSSLPWTIAEPSAQVKSDGSLVLHAPPDAYQVEISGLPEDFYLKSVRLGDQAAPDRNFEVSSGDTPVGPLELVLSPSGGRIDGLVKNAKREPASGALVVLVPDSGHRRQTYLFKETTADQNGRFTLRGVPPGEYKLFAWDDLDPGACEDPEFLRPYEDRGEKVNIEADGRETRELRLIQAEEAVQ
jgi:hypothetical protein